MAASSIVIFALVPDSLLFAGKINHGKCGFKGFINQSANTAVVLCHVSSRFSRPPIALHEFRAKRRKTRVLEEKSFPLSLSSSFSFWSNSWNAKHVVTGRRRPASSWRYLRAVRTLVNVTGVSRVSFFSRRLALTWRHYGPLVFNDE